MNRFLTAAVLGISVLAATLPAWAQTTPSTPPTPPAASGQTTPDATPPKKAKVAVIRLSDTLVERPESFSLSLASITSGGGKGPALSNLIATLNQAAKDPALSGVLIDLSGFTLTLNQAQELGALMQNVRKANKRVALYSAEFDTETYILATYADTIIMPENGELLIPGTGLQMVFFAGALEKLHMSADFVQVGKFKGAEEPYTRTSASPEYRQQIEKLVDGMYQQVISTITTNRPNLDEAAAKKAVDEAWFSGKRAKALGLVDQTINRDKLDKWVESQFATGATLVEDYGQAKKKSIDLDSPFAIFSLLGGSDKPKVSSSPAIAVLYATGEIVGDTSGAEDSTENVTPGTIRKAVQKALDDTHVKAIVLRVDSPGGSAAASDEIWAVLKEADKKKPITVSMGRLAASGGYYISCAGRSIMADPATITGSIGVVGGKVVIKGALDWAGINIEPVDKGQHAEMLSMLRPFTDEERVFVRKSMEEVYGIFESRVTAARGEKVAKLEEVAQGRLFTGIQAKAVGLVDEVGTLNDAIKAAAKTANLGENYQVINLPESKTLMDVLRDGILSDASAPIGIKGLKFDAVDSMLASLPEEIREPTRHAMRMLKMMQQEQVMVAMPAGLVEMHGR